MRAPGVRHARAISVLVVWALLCNVLLPLVAPSTVFAAPTLSLPSGTLSFPAGGAATPIDSALTVGSVANITSVTIKVDTNYQKGADVLGIADVSAFALPPTSTFDPDAGALTITAAGVESAGSWQSALRTATFVTTDQSVLTRVLFVQVNDDAPSLNTATKNVNIVGANQPPVLSRNITQSIARLATNTITGGSGGNLFTSDGDNTSAQLTYTVLTLPAAGTLSKLGTPLNVNDTFTQANVDSGGIAYLAPSNTGNQTFTFTVSDGVTTLPSSGSYTFTFTVTGATAPVLAPASASMSYPQNGAAATVDATVTLTDADAPPSGDQISSARVQFTAGYVGSQDVLDADVTSTTIAKNFDTSSGQLTLTGNATIAVYLAVLRSITYRNTLATATGSRSLSWSVTDVNGNTSGSVTRTVNIVAHVAPVVTPLSGSVTYVKGAGATVVDGATLMVTDADSTTLSAARVQVTSGYVPNQDTLEAPATLPGGITTSFDLPSGILTLSKTAPFATLSEYQDALRLVTYRNKSLSISGARTVTFTAIDEAGLLSAAASRTVSIGTGSVPSITPTSGSVNYGQGAGPTVVDGSIALNDTDAPAGPSQITNARVVVSSGYVNGQDVLAAGDLSATSLSATFSATSGDIQFTGTGTLADYALALQGVTYANNSATATGTRTLQFTVTDTEGNVSAAVNRTVTIVAHAVPQVTPLSGAAAFVRGASAIVVDPSGLTVGDSDSTNLTGARVVISAGYTPVQDVLGVNGALPSGITSSFDALTGALVLTGSATVADYQTALRQVTFVNNNAALQVPTSRNLQFTVTDETNLTSPIANRTVNITAGANPTITPNSGAFGYSVGGAPTPMDQTLTLTDADGATGDHIASARIQFTANYVNGQDQLGPVGALPGGITAAFDAPSGALTMTGPATVAEFQAALQSVTYVNTNPVVSPGFRNFSLAVTDVTGNIGSATRTVNISAHATPSITPTSGTASYLQGRPATVIDGTLFTITDGDSTTLNSARAQVTGGYVNGQDVLGVSGALPGGITASAFDGPSGVLTLNGPALLTDFQAALRQITYVNNAAGATGSRTVSFNVVDDTNLTSGTATRTISISAGVAPVLTPANGTVSFPQGGAAAAIDVNFLLNDADAPGGPNQIAGAIITVTSNYVNGEDVLSVIGSLNGGISPSFDATSGALSLSGTTTIANYQDALRKVAYQNLLASATGSRTLSITVTDVNANASAVVTRTVNIVQKAAPSITPATGSMSYSRGGPASTIDNVAIQVADTDSTTLSSARVQVTSGYVNGQDFLGPTGALVGPISASFDGPTGTLTLSGAGTPAQYTSALRLVTYRNANGSATGTRTISYVALDELNLSSATATRTVTIVSQAPPIVSPSTGLLSYTAGSAAVALDGSFTIADIDSSSLGDNDGIRITMSPFFTNQDRLSTAASLPAGFSQNFDVNTGVLTIDCTASCPQSLSAWQTALRSVTYNNLLSNPDKTDRLVSIVATDVDGNSSAPATRTITLIGAAGPPDFTGLLATDTVNEDSSKTYDLVFSDPDTPLADLSIAVTSSDQTVLPNAGLLLAGTGSDRHLTVTPAPNRNTGGGAPVIVTVTVDDGSSTVSHALSLTVAPVNDAPTISALSDRATSASIPVSFGITVGDVDTGDQLTVTGTSSNTGVVPNASVVISPAGPATTTNRTVTITPSAALGQTTITLTVADNGSPALSTSATFTLNVSGSAAPTISAIGPQTTAVNTSTPPIAFTVNDSDTALGLLALSATSSNPAVVENGVGGSTITFAGTGPNRTVAVKPKTGAVGATTISINVADETNTATASFVLTVTPGGPAVTVNQPLSVPRGGSATIGSALLAAADPDTAPVGLAFNVVAQPGAGTLRRNGAPTTSFTQDDVNSGRISYQHNGGVQPSDSFNFTVTDGTSTTALAVFSIQVTTDSIAPTTIRNAGLTVGKGVSATITRSQLEIGDLNTPVDAILFNVLPGPAYGVLKRNGSPTATFSQADVNNGLVSYQHDGSATSADSFTFTATDGTNTTGAIVFSITIVGGNTAPSLTVAPSVSVTQGKSVKLDASVLKATDPDNNPSQLTYTLTTAPTHGALKRNNQSMGSTFTQAEVDAGSISYLHDGTRTTSDSLAVRVSDGTNQTSIASLPIQITLGNSPPTLVKNTGLNAGAGLSTTILNSALLATDDDNNTGELVYTIVAAPGSGEIRRYSNPVTSFTQEDIDAGRISYAQNKQPNPGSDAFAFTLSDGTNTLGRASFSITIVGTPPVPGCPLSSSIAGTVLDLEPVSTVLNGVRTATVCTDLKIDVQTSIGKVTLEIPDDTKISAPSVYWDGKVNLPLLIANTTLTTPGANGRPTTPTAIVQVGSENVALSSDKTIKLTIPNRAGQLAGLKQGNQYIAAGADCSTVCAASAGPNLTIAGKTLGGLYYTYTDGCTPRPDVKISSVMQGTGADRHLVATVTVTSVGNTAVNGLTAVKISKRATNAVIEVNGQTVNLNDGTANDYVTLTPPPNATSFSFVVRRANPAQGVTVPVIAVDTCGGDWRTFVGAGMDAFR